MDPGFTFPGSAPSAARPATAGAAAVLLQEPVEVQVWHAGNEKEHCWISVLLGSWAPVCCRLPACLSFPLLQGQAS